jgi:hypothetical protein
MFEIIKQFAEIINISLFAVIIGFLFRMSSLQRQALTDMHKVELAGKDLKIESLTQKLEKHMAEETVENLKQQTEINKDLTDTNRRIQLELDETYKALWLFLKYGKIHQEDNNTQTTKRLMKPLINAFDYLISINKTEINNTQVTKDVGVSHHEWPMLIKSGIFKDTQYTHSLTDDGLIIFHYYKKYIKAVARL